VPYRIHAVIRCRPFLALIREAFLLRHFYQFALPYDPKIRVASPNPERPVSLVRYWKISSLAPFLEM
jgi:hypothetical protein